MRPADLVDREREWKRLDEAVASERPELVIMPGRRRSGKSYLLTRYVREVGGVYYQAAKLTEAEQLRHVTRVLAARFEDAALRHVVLPDWDAVFEYVVARAAGERFVVVFDEFPYMADAAPALPSLVQRLWDHGLEGTRVKLVLSGSHVSAMKRMTEGDQPLYGRRTARIEVRPFHYADAARFVSGWTARDRLRLYAAFGGLPGHLAVVDAKRSLAENVARHMIDSSSRLHDEAVHVFDAFVADAEVHYSVVEAIARGERRWSGISNRVGRQTSSLRRALEWLEEMEVVERVAPITDYPNPSPKRMLYGITDPYLVFWHAFVKDIRARGLAELIEPLRLWEAHIAPRLDEHMGAVFEAACRSFVAHAAHVRLPFRPMQVGSWWTHDGAEEVDLVAIGEERELLVGECKWGRAGLTDMNVLRARAARIAAELGGVRSIAYALFTAGAASMPAALRKLVRSGEVLHFTLDDLYDPAAWSGA